VAVARLLVQRPELIMADEPTASVDPRSAGIVLAALERLAAAGATLLLATHDLSIARRHRRVLALQRGRVAFSGSSDELVADVVERVYAADPEAAQAPASRPLSLRGCQ